MTVEDEKIYKRVFIKKSGTRRINKPTFNMVEIVDELKENETPSLLFAEGGVGKSYLAKNFFKEKLNWKVIDVKECEYLVDISEYCILDSIDEISIHEFTKIWEHIASKDIKKIILFTRSEFIKSHFYSAFNCYEIKNVEVKNPRLDNLFGEGEKPKIAQAVEEISSKYKLVSNEVAFMKFLGFNISIIGKQNISRFEINEFIRKYNQKNSTHIVFEELVFKKIIKKISNKNEFAVLNKTINNYFIASFFLDLTGTKNVYLKMFSKSYQQIQLKEAGRMLLLEKTIEAYECILEMISFYNFIFIFVGNGSDGHLLWEVFNHADKKKNNIDNLYLKNIIQTCNDDDSSVKLSFYQKEVTSKFNYVFLIEQLLGSINTNQFTDIFVDLSQNLKYLLLDKEYAPHFKEQWKLLKSEYKAKISKWIDFQQLKNMKSDLNLSILFDEKIELWPSAMEYSNDFGPVQDAVSIAFMHYSDAKLRKVIEWSRVRGQGNFPGLPWSMNEAFLNRYLLVCCKNKNNSINFKNFVGLLVIESENFAEIIQNFILKNIDDFKKMEDTDLSVLRDDFEFSYTRGKILISPELFKQITSNSFKPWLFERVFKTQKSQPYVKKIYTYELQANKFKEIFLKVTEGVNCDEWVVSLMHVLRETEELQQKNGYSFSSDPFPIEFSNLEDIKNHPNWTIVKDFFKKYWNLYDLLNNRGSRQCYRLLEMKIYYSGFDEVDMTPSIAALVLKNSWNKSMIRDEVGDEIKIDFARDERLFIEVSEQVNTEKDIEFIFTHFGHDINTLKSILKNIPENKLWIKYAKHLILKGNAHPSNDTLIRLIEDLTGEQYNELSKDLFNVNEENFMKTWTNGSLKKEWFIKLHSKEEFLNRIIEKIKTIDFKRSSLMDSVDDNLLFFINPMMWADEFKVFILFLKEIGFNLNEVKKIIFEWTTKINSSRSEIFEIIWSSIVWISNLSSVFSFSIENEAEEIWGKIESESSKKIFKDSFILLNGSWNSKNPTSFFDIKRFYDVYENEMSRKDLETLVQVDIAKMFADKYEELKNRSTNNRINELLVTTEIYDELQSYLLKNNGLILQKESNPLSREGRIDFIVWSKDLLIFIEVKMASDSRTILEWNNQLKKYDCNKFNSIKYLFLMLDVKNSERLPQIEKACENNDFKLVKINLFRKILK